MGRTGQSITWKKIPKEYHKVCKLLCKIFRNGVAHSDVPEGFALLSDRSSDWNNHLKFYEEGLFIFVPKLAEDITEAVKKLFK